MPGYSLRNYRDGDAPKLNELAVAAFAQLRSEYSDWSAMVSAIGRSLSWPTSVKSLSRSGISE